MPQRGVLEDGVRLVAPDELERFAELMALIQVPMEPVGPYVVRGSIGRAVLGSWKRSNTGPLIAALDDVVDDPRKLLDYLAALTLPLVALNATAEVAGAIQCIAPAKVLRNIHSRWPLRQVYKLATVAAKISGLAVDPADRGQGLGTKLLRNCVEIYKGAGFQVIFGQFEKSSSDRLYNFYSSAGFTIPDDNSVDIDIGDGYVTAISAPEHQCLFYRHLAN